MSSSKSPSLRRIQADIRELALDPSDRYHASPLEHDMFEWHFTIRGADGTDFEGGIYHGRILLPPEYPFKPPHIMFLTPSGRFETHQKVCLSFSAYHPELWQPAWGIRLILEALISFLPTPADGAIGAVDWKPAERKRLAKKSVEFCCASCGMVKDLLPKLEDVKAAKDKQANKKQSLRFAKEIEELQRLQAINEGPKKKIESADSNKSEEGDATIDDTGAAAAAAEETNEEDVKPVENFSANLVPPVPDDTNEKKEEVVVTEAKDEDENEEANTDGESTPPSAATVAEDVGTPAPAVETVQRQAPAAAREVVPNTDAAVPASDPSWMLDPLLNLMIALMAIICYLMYQRCCTTWEELKELQMMESAGDSIEDSLQEAFGQG